MATALEGELTLGNIAPTDEQRILAERDTEKHFDAIASLIGDVKENLIKIAAHYRALVELGVDRNVIRSRIGLPYLEQIAFGQVLAPLVVKFIGQKRLLSKLTQLPIPEQERFARDEPVKIMELGGDHRMVVPSEMTAQQIDQVFIDERLRTEGEQVQWLSDRRKTETPPVSFDEQVKLFPSRGYVIIAGIKFTKRQLQGIVSQLTRQKV